MARTPTGAVWWRPPVTAAKMWIPNACRCGLGRYWYSKTACPRSTRRPTPDAPSSHVTGMCGSTSAWAVPRRLSGRVTYRTTTSPLTVGTALDQKQVGGDRHSGSDGHLPVACDHLKTPTLLPIIGAWHTKT